MFGFGHALIGFLWGFLLGFGLENATNFKRSIDFFTGTMLILSLGFLVVSGSFGYGWLVAGILELVAGVFVGSMLGKR